MIDRSSAPSAGMQRLLLRAGLVDPIWYLEAYPDVAAADVDPITHYFETGWLEGRRPCAMLDPRWYGTAHQVSSEPASHFLVKGVNAGLMPNAESGDIRSLGTVAGSLGVSTIELMACLERHALSAESLQEDPVSDGLDGQRIPLKLAHRLARVEDALRSALCAKPEGTSASSGESFFSIIMPVFRPDLGLLIEAVNSVRSQNFLSWELILVDDGSHDDRLLRTLDHLALTDSRIKVVKRIQNGGISAASNEGLDSAQGQFILLVDQDDLITKDALSRLHEALESDEDIDLAYTDEAIISSNGELLNVLAKPDWSPLLLLGGMYVGHLGAYRTELVRAVGGFRSEFDFSQDFDLALRVSERARQIFHVPEVCYFWRATDTSAASGGKDFAREMNLAATQAALDRRGIVGGVVRMPKTNRVIGEPQNSEALVSIIIPTDDLEQAQLCVASILEVTIWSNYEVILLVGEISRRNFENCAWPEWVRVTVVKGKFNFSRKCNLGAADANGDFFIFLNDDTRPKSVDWINELLFVLDLPDVGAVSPRLDYEDGSIQYAGMVTGVRGLVGTAFHKFSSCEASVLNLADSLREVSILSGASLAISRKVFESVGGWNEIDTPVLHSDLDLSFRIWQLGLSCIYTPHAALMHIGHHSLSKQADILKRLDRGRATAFVMANYSDKLSRDAYFPEAIVDLAHRDFPDQFALHMAPGPWNIRATSALIVTHDLTLSGAPRLVLELAMGLRTAGCRVLVISPHDGPLRHQLLDNDVSVAVDERALSEDWSVAHLMDAFDVVVFNTVLSSRSTRNVRTGQGHVMYLHEGEYLSQLLDSNLEVSSALEKCNEIWAASRQTASRVAHLESKVHVVTGCAVPELDASSCMASIPERSDSVARSRLVIQVLGSYEPRKGQDLAIAALEILARKGKFVELRCNGRILDKNYFESLSNRVGKSSAYVALGQELDHSAYVDAITRADVVLVPSRDEPLSLVAVDALAAGKALVLSMAVGASDYVMDGRSAFVSTSPSPEHLAIALERALTALTSQPNLGALARADYERAFSTSLFRDAVVSKTKLLAAGSTLRVPRTPVRRDDTLDQDT